MQAFKDRTLGTSRFALTALCTAIAVAGCGGGGGSDGGSGGGAATTLYIGYYAEDPATNPEDPTLGAVMFTAPSGDGSFKGQMPFSYVGCAGGVDTGTITGTRSGGSLTGGWTGTLDGNGASGNFNGSYDAATDSFAGTFTTTGGKLHVVVGQCDYYIAPNGSFKVFGAATNQPASFTLTVGTSTTPTLSWPSQGASVLYAVRVFDYACLQADPSNAACFKGEASTPGNSVAYPAAFGSASALSAGTEYLAVVTAQNSATRAFLGFASKRFTPS